MNVVPKWVCSVYRAIDADSLVPENPWLFARMESGPFLKLGSWCEIPTLGFIYPLPLEHPAHVVPSITLVTHHRLRWITFTSCDPAIQYTAEGTFFPFTFGSIPSRVYIRGTGWRWASIVRRLETSPPIGSSSVHRSAKRILYPSQGTATTDPPSRSHRRRLHRIWEGDINSFTSPSRARPNGRLLHEITNKTILSTPDLTQNQTAGHGQRQSHYEVNTLAPHRSRCPHRHIERCVWTIPRKGTRI